jgi:hypothetical protein
MAIGMCYALVVAVGVHPPVLHAGVIAVAASSLFEEVAGTGAPVVAGLTSPRCLRQGLDRRIERRGHLVDRADVRPVPRCRDL